MSGSNAPCPTDSIVHLFLQTMAENNSVENEQAALSATDELSREFRNSLVENGKYGATVSVPVSFDAYAELLEYVIALSEPVKDDWTKSDCPYHRAVLSYAALAKNAPSFASRALRFAAGLDSQNEGASKAQCFLFARFLEDASGVGKAFIESTQTAKLANAFEKTLAAVVLGHELPMHELEIIENISIYFPQLLKEEHIDQFRQIAARTNDDDLVRQTLLGRFARSIRKRRPGLVDDSILKFATPDRLPDVAGLPLRKTDPQPHL